MLNYFDLADTQVSLPDFVPLHLVTAARSLLADTNVMPRGELIGHYQFPSMDRVMHLRPGFGFGVAMFSSRIYNYESINTENLKGWYTADGTTWLYNDDLTQFTDSFWPTIDPYHLPGTTVDLVPRANSWGQSKISSQNWVGGSVLEGTYGAAGMAFAAIDSTSTLTGRKSWFLFDDEIVCLGAGISAGGTNTVHTTVENRRLNRSGSNGMIVDGVPMPTTLGWSSNFTALNWCAIAGAGGYFFPGRSRVQASRYARSGCWYDINTQPQPTAALTNLITRNYLTLVLNHGIAPANASYSYVLLPNKSSDQVGAYAAAPEVQIVENSTQAQAVRELQLGLLAVNFWDNSPRTVDFVSCSAPASVISREQSGELVVAVSDPTQTNTGSISLTLARSALGVSFADTNITVTRLAPTIHMSVNVNGRKGLSSTVKFRLVTEQ
jgi:hyaluronate lyase